MNYITKVFCMIIAGASFLYLPQILPAKGPGGGGNGPGGGGGGTVLDINEETHLLFMRAEEKLAHDVYSVLGQEFPDYAFRNIVDSETNHTDSMIDALAAYSLDDPNIADGLGEFAEENFGEYFTVKFTALSTLQAENQDDRLLEALKNGALIEELDMHDIVMCPVVIVDADNGIGPDECGMDYTDEKLLVNKYDNLLEGSKKHLRAFVRQIESTFPDQIPYTAQYLTQEEVDEILGR
jgi:hypothetical protein